MKKEKLNVFDKVDFLLLTFILVVAMAMRLYGYTLPLADFHSWRQADTAAVARNFARDGFDLLHPKFDDISPIQSGLENPHGYRFVEFPLYNAVFAATYKLFPSLPIEVHGRLVSSVFSLIIIAIIYYFLQKEYGKIAAVSASLIYALYPFFVFYSRVVLPETTALGMAMLSIFFLYKSQIHEKKPAIIIYYILSVVSFALALLVKPTVIFYGLALAYLFFRQFEFKIFKKIHVYLFFILVAIPLFWWRRYILAFPEGIPSSTWLITSVNTPNGLLPVFFRPAFFRWIFFERINNLILGGYTTFFFLLGCIARYKRYFSYSILASAFAYIFVFQGGNVQHEYYQVLILPALAIMSGIGVMFMLKNSRLFIHPIFLYGLIICVACISFFVSYYRIRDYYNYPAELEHMATVIKTLTQPTDKIVTDRTGDTTLLYLADRKGAPAVYKDLGELKKEGYSYFITNNSAVIETIKKTTDFDPVFENDKFALFHL